MDALKLTIKIPEAQSEQLLTAYSSELELAGAIENAKQVASQFFDLTLNEKTKKEVDMRRDKTKSAMEVIHNIFENKILEKCASIIVGSKKEERAPNTDLVTQSDSETEIKADAKEISGTETNITTNEKEQQQKVSSTNTGTTANTDNKNEDTAVAVNEDSGATDHADDVDKTEEAQSAPLVSFDSNTDLKRYSTYLKIIADTTVDQIEWLRKVKDDASSFIGGTYSTLDPEVIECAAKVRLYDLLASNKELCIRREAYNLKHDYDIHEGFRYARSILSNQIMSLGSNFSVYLYYKYLDGIGEGKPSQRIKARQTLLGMIANNEASVPNSDRVKLHAEMERLDAYFMKKNDSKESPKSTDGTDSGANSADNGEQDNGQEKTE